MGSAVGVANYNLYILYSEIQTNLLLAPPNPKAPRQERFDCISELQVKLKNA